MAQELKTVLGFEAASAIATLAAMEGQLKTWTATMRGAASATSVFNRAAKGTTASMGVLTSSKQAMASISPSVVNSQTRITEAISGISTEATRAAKKVDKSSKDMILSWQSVIRIFVIQTVHQVISKVTAAIAEGVTAARDYEIALADIQTIAPEFRKDFESLSAEVRNFSDAMGVSVELVAEGVYQTLSNQVAGAGKAFQFMADAQAFATAAATDTASSVNLLSSIINSYNMNVEDAAEIGGKLAKTIELGRIRGEEFANTVGRITTLSAQLGISLDEVLTSITVLTVSGMRWNEAFTLLTNIQLKLIRPTEALKTRFKELGVTSAEAGIAAYGFQGFLDKITESSGASASALGEMFNRVRAIRGALGLTNENAERYVKNLEEIKAAGAEAVFERKAIIFETNAKQVEVELNRLRNVMVVDLGRGINEVGLAFFQAFGGGVEALKALTISATAAGSVFLILSFRAAAAATTIVSGFSAATAATTRFGVALWALMKTPAALAAVTAVAVAGIIMWLNRGKAVALEMRHAIEKGAAGKLASRLAEIRQETKAQILSNKEKLSSVLLYLQARTVAQEATLKRISIVERATLDSLTEQIGVKTSALESYFKKLEGVVADVDSKIKDLNRNIQGIHFDISDFTFEREVNKGFSAVEKSALWMERSAVLRKKALEAIKRREFEIADIYNQRAKSAAMVALRSADESENKQLIKRAEEGVVTAEENRIKVLGQKSKFAKGDAEAADDMLKKMSGSRALLKSINTEMDDLIKKFADAKFDPVEKDKIKKELLVIAEDAQDIFSKLATGVDLAAQLNLEKQFKEAVKGIRDPRTGEQGKITVILDLSIDRFLANLREAFESVTDLDKDIADLPGFTGKSAREQQELAIVTTKMLDDSAKAAEARETAEAKIAEELKLQAVNIKAIGEAYKGTIPIFEKFILAGSKIEEMAGVPPLTLIPKETLQIAKDYNEAIGTAIALTKEIGKETPDFERASALKETLGRLRDEATDVGKVDIVTTINTMLEGINAIIDAQQEIAAIDMSDKILPEAEAAKVQAQWDKIGNKIDKTKGKTGAVKEGMRAVGPAAAVGAGGAIAAGSRIIASLEAQTRAAIKRNAAMAGAGGGKGKTQSDQSSQFGGVIYRALGGLTSRGTDTQLVAATPGEFIVNADSSRKFFSQLVAMNAGVPPQFRESGGPVTNVGDVNITVNETVSARATARETMAAFRREMRKRTSRL